MADDEGSAVARFACHAESAAADEASLLPCPPVFPLAEQPRKQALDEVRRRIKHLMDFKARFLLASFTLLAGASLLPPLPAQEAGQETAPPSLNQKPLQKPPTQTTAPNPTPPPQPASAISTEPPSIPVDQIIQRFAEREAEFRKERDNFTYVQTFIVQTIDDDGNPDGEYRMTSDVTFLSSGERYEKITYAPPPTLQRVSLSEQDLDDLKNIQPFVLTTGELPKYDISYVGREKVDELTTYVFDVKPKKIEKNQRYFEGRVWVDDQDLEIVKTDGKAVPDIRKGGNENVFPRFETYRENIEGHYWFPTYTHADDVLHFAVQGNVHIRMTVRYSDYKRFRSSYRLVPISPDQPKPQNP